MEELGTESTALSELSSVAMEVAATTSRGRVIAIDLLCEKERVAKLKEPNLEGEDRIGALTMIPELERSMIGVVGYLLL